MMFPILHITMHLDSQKKYNTTTFQHSNHKSWNHIAVFQAYVDDVYCKLKSKAE